MLKRAVIIALAMLVVYNLLLLSPRVRNLYSIQSQWQNNLITAQRYTLANPPPDVVLVGSSLAAQMAKKKLEPEIFNLAFAGGSAFTGLELIQAAKHKPKLVIIEMNVLWKKADPAIIENVSRPVLASLRSQAPVFQEQWQPANLLAGRLTRSPLEKLCEAKYRFVHDKQQAKPENEIFGRMLAIEQENNNTPIESKLMAAQITALHGHIQLLEKHGVRCAFLEMPVDPRIAALPRSTSIREKVSQEFPASQYQWITPEPGHVYKTTDGQHLQSFEAEAYALYIRAAVKDTKWPAWRSASAARPITGSQ